MIQKTHRVYLRLQTNEGIAREISEQVLARANPHSQELVRQELEAKGITRDNLVKYFMQLSGVVTEFWHAQWDLNVGLTVKPHEIRGLYLPLMYGVVFASVGNIKVGNYEYFLKSDDSETSTIDKKFLFEFSANLESLRDYVKGSTGQIGNRNAQPQSAVMLCLLGEIHPENVQTARMQVRDGISFDKDLAGLAVLAGVSLVEKAEDILYTGVEEINFRQLTETLIEKGLVVGRRNGNGGKIATSSEPE